MNVDLLISRVIKGSASVTEIATLAAWRRKSAANERHFQELSGLLREVEAAALGEEMDPPPLLEELLAPGGMAPPRADGGRRTWVPAAISAMAVAAVALLFLTSARGAREPGGASLGPGEIVTGRLESTTIRLADGTVVRLGPESRLRLAGDPGRREVWLDGRGFFAVTKAEGRPFRIRTHSGDAVVLGTRFDLEAREEDLRVLVVEGAVRLGAAGGQVEVEASEVGTVGPDQRPRSEPIDSRTLEGELSWLGNFIVFDRTPLAQAARELSAHYGVPVEVLDSSLAEETIQGVFNDESLEEVIRVLCRATSAHCTVGKSRVTIGL